MTTPVSAGYPDFARMESEAQVLELNDTNVTNTGIKFYPVRYVGSAKALFCWAQTFTVSAQIAIRFFADSAGLVLLDSIGIDISVGVTARQAVPILGPYMDVYIQPNGGGANNYTLQLWRTPFLATSNNGNANPATFSSYQLNINAGATITLTAGEVYMGNAWWNGAMSGGAWDMEIQSVGFDGTITILDRIDSAAASGLLHQLFLPAMTIQAVIHNTSAGAQLYRLTMTRDRVGIAR